MTPLTFLFSAPIILYRKVDISFLLNSFFQVLNECVFLTNVVAASRVINFVAGDLLLLFEVANDGALAETASYLALSLRVVLV